MTRTARVLSVRTIGDMIKVSLHLISTQEIIKNLFFKTCSIQQRAKTISLFLIYYSLGEIHIISINIVPAISIIIRCTQ